MDPFLLIRVWQVTPLIEKENPKNYKIVICTSVALLKSTSPGAQVRFVKSGWYGLQRIGSRGPDWLKYNGLKLGEKLEFETLLMTWLTTLTSWVVTSLLFVMVSCAVMLSTHGRISSNAVWAVGFLTHWFIAIQLSAVTLHVKELNIRLQPTIINCRYVSQGRCINRNSRTK